MQAAATRLPNPERKRRSQIVNPSPHLAVADDLGLLNALPIAAAVVENCSGDAFKIAAHNNRFLDTVKKSNCTALDWNEALKEPAHPTK